VVGSAGTAPAGRADTSALREVVRVSSRTCYIGGRVIWSESTSEEIRAAAADGLVAVLPVGAVEQHGPHLPTGTDALLAEHAAKAACSRTGDVLLPTLALGCSLGHTDKWPGTLSLTPATQTLVVLELGRWVYASGFRRLFLVNAHATNGPPCQSALLQLRYELPDLLVRFVSVFDLTPEIAARYRSDAEDFHANAAETSLVLHVAPDQVRMGEAVDEEDRTVGRIWQYAMPAVSRSGVVGAPSKAEPHSGESLLELVVAALVDMLASARDERVEL
jgi:creatinine amidohydrolase